MRAALLVLLAIGPSAPPPAPDNTTTARVGIQDEGTFKGYARTLNCVGSGLSCVADGSVAVLTSVSSDAGYSTLSISCPGGQFLWGVDGGGPVCAIPDAGFLSVACATGKYLSALDAGGPVCATPAGVPGGSSPQIQYNNSGAFGGVTNFQSDGTRPSIVAETTHPSAPGSNSLAYDYNPVAGFPPEPFRISSAYGFPENDGRIAGAVFQPIPDSLASTWPRCSVIDAWGGTTWASVGLSQNPITCTEGSATGSGNIDAGTWFGRQRWHRGTSATTANASVDCHMQALHSITGSGACSGCGGFRWWGRACIIKKPPNGQVDNWRVFFGLAGTVTAFGAVEPSNIPNTIYFGCDPTESNLQVKSNDSSGAATTQKDLGSSFPCKTPGACFDMWLDNPPGSSTVYWFVRRLPDSDGTSRTSTDKGSFSTDIPGSNIQLATHIAVNNADSGVGIQMATTGSCTWDNW